MSCCIIGLAMIYQLIAAWQAIARWCGVPRRAARATRHWLRHLDFRMLVQIRPYLLTVLLAFESGAAVAFMRSDHISTAGFITSNLNELRVSYLSMCSHARILLHLTDNYF